MRQPEGGNLATCAEMDSIVFHAYSYRIGAHRIIMRSSKKEGIMA
jgi:hypothetical protein